LTTGLDADSSGVEVFDNLAITPAARFSVNRLSVKLADKRHSRVLK
jgi:hypothetical protein